MSVQLIKNMPFAEYLALDRLSSGGIKDLAAGSLTFWYKKYGPGRKGASTRAKTNGTATHVAGLEGIAAFEHAYAPALDLTDYPGALVYQSDLRAWCKEHDLKVGGTKTELAERIDFACHELGYPHPPIWHEIIGAHALAAEEHGQELMTWDDYADALAKGRLVEPILAPARGRGGIAEVTILWDNLDMPCKARLDFLAPRTVVDLKNVANKRDENFSDLCSREIANRDMAVQAEWYLMAATVANEAGLMPWEDDHGGPFTFDWIFVQSTGPRNILMRRYMQKTRRITTERTEESAVSYQARGIIGRAMGTYRQYQKSHGPDRPWVPPLDVRDMTDDEYPAWYLMKDRW